jgi:hypothetical protein
MKESIDWRDVLLKLWDSASSGYRNNFVDVEASSSYGYSVTSLMSLAGDRRSFKSYEKAISYLKNLETEFNAKPARKFEIVNIIVFPLYEHNRPTERWDWICKVNVAPTKSENPIEFRGSAKQDRETFQGFAEAAADANKVMGRIQADHLWH